LRAAGIPDKALWAAIELIGIHEPNDPLHHLGVGSLRSNLKLGHDHDPARLPDSVSGRDYLALWEGSLYLEER
jgi:hypothetical protein